MACHPLWPGIFHSTPVAALLGHSRKFDAASSLSQLGIRGLVLFYRTLSPSAFIRLRDSPSNSGYSARLRLACPSPPCEEMMRFDGQDPSLAPLESVADRRTPAPLSDRQRQNGLQSITADRHDESTLVDEARSRSTDHDESGRDDNTGAESPTSAGGTGPTAAGAKTWHNPIFADKARGIRTRALRFVSFLLLL